MSDVIAILVSDLHLSHTTPLARSSEPSWYGAMATALGQLEDLANQHDPAPVICAGDVFDRWNSNPELINFAIVHLPRMYAIPGQHDLPHHRLEDVRRSAYWTLVEAGVIDNIDVVNDDNPDFIMWGFPWGRAINPPVVEEGSKTLHIAVAHKYVWEGEHHYDGAPKTDHLSKLAKQLDGYDVAVFGDNHKGFQANILDGCTVFNCGTFMRRKVDEVDYMPAVGLLYNDGTVGTCFLDTSQDKIEVVEKTTADDELDIAEFVEELNGLGGDFLDFETAVVRYVEKHGIVKPVREVIQRIMEDGHAKGAVGK